MTKLYENQFVFVWSDILLLLPFQCLWTNCKLQDATLKSVTRIRCLESVYITVSSDILVFLRWIQIKDTWFTVTRHSREMYTPFTSLDFCWSLFWWWSYEGFLQLSQRKCLTFRQHSVMSLGIRVQKSHLIGCRDSSITIPKGTFSGYK